MIADSVATTLIVTVGTIVTTLLGLIFKYISDKLSDIGGKVDGRYTALEEEIRAYRLEIIRLQQVGTTTPYGIPDKTNPVTLGGIGVPTTDTKDST